MYWVRWRIDRGHGAVNSWTAHPPRYEAHHLSTPNMRIGWAQILLFAALLLCRYLVPRSFDGPCSSMAGSMSRPGERSVSADQQSLLIGVDSTWLCSCETKQTIQNRVRRYGVPITQQAPFLSDHVKPHDIPAQPAQERAMGEVSPNHCPAMVSRLFWLHPAAV
eukprot:364480-Chlamydomonas_euryale.AAC.10